MQSLLMSKESENTALIPNCNSSVEEQAEDSDDSESALIDALPEDKIPEIGSTFSCNGSATKHDPISSPVLNDCSPHMRAENEITAEQTHVSMFPKSAETTTSNNTNLIKMERVMDIESNNEEVVEDLTNNGEVVEDLKNDDTDTGSDCAHNGESVSMEIKINPADIPLIEIEENPANFEFCPQVEDETVDPLQDTSEHEVPLLIPPNHRMCHTCGEFFPSSDRSNHCGPPDESPPQKKKYPCSQCRKVFLREDLLDEHIFVHSSNQYICDRCGMFFGHKEDLTAHERTHKGIIKCTECQESFNDKGEMDSHSKKTKSSICCVPCDAHFWNKCAYNRHVRTHSLLRGLVAVEIPKSSLPKEPVNSKVVVNKSHTCEHCGNTYVNRYNLMRHIKKVTIPSSSRARKIENPFSCDMCDEKFAAHCRLRKHKLEEHSELFAKSEDDENTAISTVGTRTVAENVSLKTNSTNVPSRIQIVNHNQKASKFQSSVMQYRNVSTVSSVKRIADYDSQCNVCGETFSSVFCLNDHIRLVHSKPLQLSCHICDRSFSRQDDLKLHYREHKNLKHRTCGLCGKMFASKRNVIRHQVVHTRSMESIPKVPETSALPTIRAESNIPTPQEPTTPPFQTQNAMTYVELLTHVSGSRQPFRCDWCKKTFVYKRMFVEHYLSHTGEKPFACEICDQRFVRERNMYSHLETHRRKKEWPRANIWKEETVTTTGACNTLNDVNAPRILTRRNASKSAAVVHQSENQLTDSSDLDATPTTVASIDYEGRPIIPASTDPKLLLPSDAEEMFRVQPSVRLFKLNASFFEDSVYVCSICDKFFPRPISLTAHKKTCMYLQKKRLEKELALKQQPVSKFVSKLPVVSHRAFFPKQFTDPFTRRIQFSANNRFLKISNIQHRIVVENKEKFFVCGKCNQRFKRRYSLVEHCHKHTGEKPFPCQFCNSSFTRKSNLRKHFLHYHTEEPSSNAVTETDMFDDKEDYNTEFEGKYADEMMVKKTEFCTIVNQNVEQTGLIDSVVDEDESENELDPYYEIFEPQCIVKDEKSDEETSPYVDNAVSSYGDNKTASYGDDVIVPFQNIRIAPYGNARVAVYGDGRNASYEDTKIASYKDNNVAFYRDDRIAPFGDVKIAQYEDRVTLYDDKLENAPMNHFLELSTSTNGFGLAYQNGDDLEDHTQDSIENVILPEDEENMGSRFVCAQCNSTFLHREELLRHYSVHESERTFVCYYCKKEFARRKYLTKHALIHIRKKEHPCSQCEKSYRTQAELMKHIRIHTGEKPFACDQCCKCFRESKQLQLHYRSHTGERPYVCGNCAMSFFRPDTLSRHMRTCKIDNIMDTDVD